ncbi:MAG: isoprenylcysteine carboxylmethyltransferase family protein [Anaerolineales bacterium]|nr:isoprenylcysteine carboxylmethyltransferase family protein [Anaerolineales bacterium]
MKRERVIEIATYIMVFLAMWIISPWIGKLLDQLYYPHPKLFSNSLLLLLVSGMIAILGFGLAIWTIVIFKTIGKGTPNPKVPPTEMVISGPYKYSRNPMAFGGFLFLLGESGIYQSPSLAGLAVLFAVILYLNTVYIEEPQLRKRFGQPYEKYCETVPRFLPKLFGHAK